MVSEIGILTTELLVDFFLKGKSTKPNHTDKHRYMPNSDFFLMQVTKISELLFFSFLNALQEKEKSLELVTGMETQT